MVGLVQKSEKLRYIELKIYMHNSYVNGEDRWTKTLSATLDVIIN